MNKTKAQSGSNVSVNDAITKLWAEMPTQQRVIAKSRTGENIYGTYIKVPNLLRRLQEVFGLNYDIHFSEHYIKDETSNTTVVVVRCELGVETPDGYRTYTDYASEELFVDGRFNENAVKSAATDAFKRAVRWLGVGMFQYEDDAPTILSEAPKKRDLDEEVRRLVEEKPDAAVAVVNTVLDLAIDDGIEPLNEYNAIRTLCQRYNLTPKQAMFIFRDSGRGQDFLSSGMKPSEFINRVLGKTP